MDDRETTEAYFVARGWSAWPFTIHPGSEQGWLPPGKELLEANLIYELPNILGSFSAFREHALEVMEEKGWEFLISEGDSFSDRPYVVWNQLQGGGLIQAEIIDNNILHAAVIGATRYFKSMGKTS